MSVVAQPPARVVPMMITDEWYVLRHGAALSVAYLLSMVVALIMIASAAVGLFLDGVYPHGAWAVAASRGNDMATLVVAAPALGMSLAHIRQRERPEPVLVWLGMLCYSVDTHARSALVTAFEATFLLHVAALACSAVALVLAIATLDAPRAARRVASGPRARLVAAVLVAVGTALVLGWGGPFARFALTGRPPEAVAPTSVAHLGDAFGLSLLAPALLIGGVLLWRGTAWGAVLGVAVTVFGACRAVALEFTAGFQADAGIPGGTWMAPAPIAAAVLCLVALAVLLPADKSGT